MFESIFDKGDMLLECARHQFYLILPYLIQGQLYLFLIMMIIATVGKRFGLRRLYILLLDRLFQFAAVTTTEENCVEDIAEEKCMENEVEDTLVISPQFPRVPSRSCSECEGTAAPFLFDDLLPYVTAGVQSVVEDAVISRFQTPENDSWNMLSRTKKPRVKQKRSVTILWVLGVIFRYFFQLPVRLAIFFISVATLIASTFLVGRLPNGQLKKTVNAMAVCWSFDFLANAISVFARFHNRQNRPQYGIAVANHTSPIDSMVLATDNCYDMVGQKTKGVLGIFMSALSKSSTHIWFDRSSSKQRSNVLDFIQQHAQDHSLPPILTYPEGICINNTAIFIFKKGIFQLDTTIYPIAVKFDLRYGDPFWWQDSFFFYILSMMTSWAIVCDVWYLSPMRREPGEDPSVFANRVKSAIANAGGLEEAAWDGGVKLLHDKVQKKNKEDIWRRKQQYEFAKFVEDRCAEGSEKDK